MIPTSTYRLQITPGFRLQDAAALVDYFDDLGVGAVYLSPVLTSTTGSDHGYDATDPTTIDPQRGGEEGWLELVTACQQRGLGVVLDIVPNHLGVSRPGENPAWWSVLEQGADSPYAGWFDIDWSADRLNIPVLGSEDDLAALVLSDDATELHFYEHRYPVRPGTATVGDDPREVHDRQAYRLIPGVEGNARLGYRRFFAVETLAGLRIEDPAVFDATHERVLRMVHDGQLTGLRVDHPDGLVDPAGYFERLRTAVGSMWLVAEKILEHGEPLPSWQVDGTTGYDAMTEVNQLFVDPSAEGAFTVDYQERTGDQRSVDEHVLIGKTMVARTLFIAETNRIMALLDAGASSTEQLRDALLETAVRLDVYRTYLPEDARALDEALAAARAARPDLTEALDVLAPQLHDVDNEAARRFQQLTGAVMAKGVEDTAWYRANRFVALNEVGGNPASFGSGLDAFHHAMERRERDLPRSMTSLSTHDTKRGEEVRANLAALSELFDVWARFSRIFHERTDISEPTMAWLVAQTLVATGPVVPSRLHDYATKAMREAGLATSWITPDAGFEDSVHAAIETAYHDEVLNQAWRRAHEAITQPGRSNSASQKLVQLTMPGIPDVYQGTEVWEDSLVDPDNRRPLDQEGLRELLGTRPTSPGDPAFKHHLVRTTLRLRRERPELFHGYRPLHATGPAADHLVAFERAGLVTLATRLPVGLGRDGGWQDTHLRLEGSWTDVLTGARVEGDLLVDQLLGHSPVALLVKD